ncbi:MAG: L-histidine N(alpha)-methyltransferase [Candidatus Dormibacteria bacterium]
MTKALAPLTVAIHTVGRNSRDELVADVRSGLTARPKTLPPRWFYDELGSRLFEQITALPEYYQTRTEAAILRVHAPAIAARVRPESLVELGAGSCAKSRILIDSCRRLGTLSTFIPFDISESALLAAGRELLEEYPGLTVHAMVGDFATHLDLIPRHGRRLVIFLGSTIGNFDDEGRRLFLGQVRGLLAPGDALLLGLDLVKPVSDMLAAYDDAEGVTAEFNLNLLNVLNRELEADFDASGFEHAVRYDEALHRMEMHLRSRREQTVRLPVADLEVHFQAGELMRTEISVKFTPPIAEELLGAASLRVDGWFTDPQKRFAMALAVPT